MLSRADEGLGRRAGARFRTADATLFANYREALSDAQRSC